MTKKVSDKNKAWEKDRRDRLNKAFEQLAKILPQFDPSTNWSKIEIIQKSIEHIEKLHEKHKNFLETNDLEALKNYKELDDCLKYFQRRNGQLSELLKEANINIPILKLPKFLEDNPKFIENTQPQLFKPRPVGRPKKYANLLSVESNQNISEKNVEILGKNNKENNSITNSKLCEFNPSKQNKIITTPAIVTTGVLLPLIPCHTIASNPETTSLPTKVSISSICDPINAKIHNTKRNKLKSINPLKDKNGKVKILAKPVIKFYYRGTDNKIPIPILKNKKLTLNKRKRRKNLNSSEKQQSAKKPKTDKNIGNNVIIIKHKCQHNNVILNKKDKVTNSEIPTLQNSNDIKIVTKNNVELNNRTISPTAAYLSSFPVVSSGTIISSKNDNTSIKPIVADTIIENVTSLTENNSSNAIISNLTNNNQITEMVKISTETNGKHIQNSSINTTKDSISELYTLPFKYSFTQANLMSDYPIKPMISLDNQSSSAIKMQNILPTISSSICTYSSENLFVSSKEGETVEKPKDNINSMDNILTSSHLQNTTNNTLPTFTYPYKSSSSTHPNVNKSTNLTFPNLSSTINMNTFNTDTWKPIDSICSSIVSSNPLPLPSTFNTYNIENQNSQSLLNTNNQKCQFNCITNCYHNNCNQTTSGFTFNLSNTDKNTTVNNLSSISHTQPIVTYSNIKPDLQWIQPLTSDYTTTFTFSLTPPTPTYTKSINSSNINLNLENISKNTIQSDINTKFDAFSNYPRINATQTYENKCPIITNETTNFTFSLTNTTNTFETDKTLPKILNNKTINCNTNYTNLIDNKNYPLQQISACENYESNNLNGFSFSLTKTTESSTVAYTKTKPFTIDAVHIDNYYNQNNKDQIFNTHEINLLNSDYTYTGSDTKRIQNSKLEKTQKNHVNWMTSNDFILTPHENSLGLSCQTTNTSQINLNNKKNEISFPNFNFDDNLPPWSPSKILDTSHLIPGSFSNDLQQNNYFTINPMENTKCDIQIKNEKTTKLNTNSSNITSNQTNFFSVTQLVDQADNSNQMKLITEKKNNFNKNTKSCNSAVYNENMKISYSDNQQLFQNINKIQTETTNKSTNIPSNGCFSNYSAEALISKKENLKNLISTSNNKNFSSIPVNNFVIDSNYNSNYFYNYITNQNYIQNNEQLQNSSYPTDSTVIKSNDKSFIDSRTSQENYLPIKSSNNSAINFSNFTNCDTSSFRISSSSTMPPTESVQQTEIYDSQNFCQTNNFSQNSNWNTKSLISIPPHQLNYQNVRNTSNPENTSGSNNITNFNLSTICPEISENLAQNNW